MKRYRKEKYGLSVQGLNIVSGHQARQLLARLPADHIPASMPINLRGHKATATIRRCAVRYRGQWELTGGVVVKIWPLATAGPCNWPASFIRRLRPGWTDKQVISAFRHCWAEALLMCIHQARCAVLEDKVTATGFDQRADLDALLDAGRAAGHTDEYDEMNTEDVHYWRHIVENKSQQPATEASCAS